MEKRKEFMPFYKPMIGDDEINKVSGVLRSGWLSTGPMKTQFEKEMAEFFGARNCVGMNSCTAALHTALIAKGIGKGDEVITTPFTFCATANVIMHVQAKPVLIDIDPISLCIDPAQIQKNITQNTKALIPVHYGGHPCDMDKLYNICKKFGLFLLEDAAHAIGAEYKGKKIGSFGDASAFSFYATKNLTTSEGGMLVTNDDDLAQKARIISLHGMNHNAWKRYAQGSSWYYEVEMPGYKYNMTDIQAAIGLAQLERFLYMQKIRKKFADMYDEGFNNLEELILHNESADTLHARHLYTIRVKKDAGLNRDHIIKKLNELNIGTSVHFIPIHYHPYYKKMLSYKRGDFPITESVFENIISLPLYPSMTKEDVEYVIKAVCHIIKEY